MNPSFSLVRPFYLAAACLMAVAPLTAHAASLDDYVAAALAHNPGLHAALQRVEAAKAVADGARSAYYPSFFVGANYTRTDNPTHAFMMALNQRSLDMADPELDFNNPEDRDNVRLTAGARYRLYDGGQRGALQGMMRQQVEAERYGEEAARNTLIYTVMEAYYRALQARAFVAVHEEALASMEENLRVARQRLDAGAAVITDVLNLDVQVAQAREQSISARHGFELALNVLNTAIGLEMVKADELAEPAQDVPSLPTETEHTLENHPELRAVQAMLGLRDEEVRKARRAYAPTLNAFGSWDWDSEVSSDFEQSYLVGLSAEWDIFDGFRRRSDLRAARARREEAKSRYADAENQLRLDVKQAYVRAKDALERLTVMQASEESARSAWSVTRDQYEQGAATLADLLTAQSGYTATRARRTAAHYDYLTALANWKRAQGEWALIY